MNDFFKYYDEIIELLKEMPGIGKKAAERIFDNLLINKNKIENLQEAMLKIKENTTQCSECFALKINDSCLICDDSNRNKNKLCIVSSIRDFIVIEKSNNYKGLFHILNGEIAVKKNINPENLNINALISRLEKHPEITEILFALNLTFEGEVTLSYIKKIIQNQFPKIEINRISQGLPLGGMIEYIDEYTLKKALEDQKKV